jgi:hypothetical protein
MKLSRRFARRFRLLELLRAVLFVGAAVNTGIAVALTALPRRAAETLGLALPDGRVVLWLLAGVLVTSSALYLLAARDPRRYSGVIVALVAGRVLGSAALGAGALARAEPGQLWLFAAVELAFAVALAGCWLPLRA